MAEASAGRQNGDDSVQLGGLPAGAETDARLLSGIFAISFAFISVAVGIFATYDDVLQNAGPVGIWLWVIAAVGQTLVASALAQFAARIPLSGSSCQWASRLANPKIGWGFGWLTFCNLALVVAVAIALFIAAAITGNGAVGNLTSRGVTENAPDYLAVGGGLMLAMIMGLATLVGFDAAANLAEEAKIPIAVSRARSWDRSWQPGCWDCCS